MKNRKLIVAFLSIAMCMACSSVAFCEDGEKLIKTEPNLKFDEKRVSAWNTNEETPKIVKNGIIIHNNGNPIQTDIFAKEDSEGDSLVAICYSEKNGIPAESYYFTNEPDGNKTALYEWINEKEMASEKTTVPKAAAVEGTQNKSYNWEHKKDAKVLGRMTTNINFIRHTKSGTYNGKKCSIWDVKTTSQLERVSATNIEGYYTKLSSIGSDQHLHDYGPTGNQSGGTVTVGLSGAAPAPDVSYTFPLSGISYEDYSSLSGGYGRWYFHTRSGILSSLSSLTSKPGMRIINETGSLTFKIEHESKLVWPGGVVSFKTTPITTYIGDRS